MNLFFKYFSLNKFFIFYIKTKILKLLDIGPPYSKTTTLKQISSGMCVFPPFSLSISLSLSQTTKYPTNTHKQNMT